MKETEQKILDAIKAGASTYEALMAATGLKYHRIANCLSMLYIEHDVRNLAGLYRLLKPTPVPQFTSHDSTIVDKDLKPALAAVGLVSVLGVEYCEELILAITAEIEQKRIKELVQ